MLLIIAESDIYAGSHSANVSSIVRNLLTTGSSIILLCLVISTFMVAGAEEKIFPNSWNIIVDGNPDVIKFSPDGNTVAIGYQNGTVVGFNHTSQEIDWTIKENYSIRALEWTYSSGDLVLAVGMGSWNNTNRGGLRIYTIPDMSLLESSHFNEWISCLSSDPSHTKLGVSGPHYGNVDILNTTDWTLIDNYHPYGYTVAIDYSDIGHLAVSSYQFIELDGRPFRGIVEILYLSSEDEIELYSTIGPFPVIATYLEWRPHSSNMVFGNETMYLADANTEDFEVLIENLPALATGAWEGNGKLLFFSNYSKLWVMDVENEIILNMTNFGIWIKDIDISHDNRFIGVCNGAKVEVGAINVNYNFIEKDSDDDGYPDTIDRFPEDPNEWNDTDNDTVGDNSDVFPNDPNEWNDTDNDTVGDNSDTFPNDPNEWKDSDNDTFGDNSDTFPNDPNEWIDTDGDGVGNNTDAFPEDPYEWMDSDGDKVGDNSDVFPFDPSEWKDSDGDGYGDRIDPYPHDPLRPGEGEPKPNVSKDSDNDTVPDDEDKFPNDPAASVDVDMDGYPDEWNPGMNQNDSTTGLELDRYLNDPRDQSDKDPDRVRIDGYILVPVIIFTTALLFILAAFIVIRSIGRRSGDLTKEEERIKEYIRDITRSGDTGEIELDSDSIRVLLEDSKFDGRISESTYRSIQEILD